MFSISTAGWHRTQSYTTCRDLYSKMRGFAGKVGALCLGAQPALGQGLAAEELECEGAEEGRDAVLAQQVQFDELRHSSGKLSLQQLHLGPCRTRRLWAGQRRGQCWGRDQLSWSWGRSVLGLRLGTDWDSCLTVWKTLWRMETDMAILYSPKLDLCPARRRKG